MKSKKAMTKWVALVMVAALWLPNLAWADRGGDLVVLLTEVVEAGLIDENQQLAFWWSEVDEPKWTASDVLIFEALVNSGVAPAQPTQVNISRIYRRPGLSTANAAQLGALLDGERVLVGEVQYRPIAPVAPLGYRGVEIRAEVELVPAGDTEGITLDRFTVRRQVFGNDSDTLLDEARQVAGTALGEVIGHSLQRTAGEIGSRNHGRLLALRNVERAENLEEVRDRLQEIEEVKGVVERWASEGMIAFEVQTMEGASTDILDYIYQVLGNHQFDDFYLMRSEGTIEGVTEFWLEPRQSGF